MACQHDHGPLQYNRAFAVGIGLNVAFVVAEFVAGVWGNSLALLADAGHNLSDVAGLLIAWGAYALAKRPTNGRRTYGWRSGTIVAAVVNALLLLVAVGVIAWEAAHRFGSEATTESLTMIVVAGIGVVINAVTAWLFLAGADRDLNLRGAYLHMAADAAVSLGVVLSGIGLALTGAAWIDPAVSLAIAALILLGTWGLLRESVDLLLHSAPTGIDVDELNNYLENLDGVTAVHDLHVWAISTTETALTAHLVRPSHVVGDGFLPATEHDLRHHFPLTHITLQIEGEGECERHCH